MHAHSRDLDDDGDLEISGFSVVLLVEQARRFPRSEVLEAFRLWFGFDVVSVHTDPIPLGDRDRVLEALEHAEPVLDAGRAAIYESDGVIKIVTPDSGILVVEHVASPWFDEPARVAAPIADARFARGIREHRAFVEFGLLGLEVVDEPMVATRRLCRFAAAFCDDGVIGIAIPDRELLGPNLPAVVDALCGDEPFDWPEFTRSSSVVGDTRTIGAHESGDFDRAAAEARRRWPEFVSAFAVAASGDGRTDAAFTVKIGLYEGEVCENLWFWVTAIDGAKIECVLESEPIYLTGVRRGQTRSFELSEVLDWVYTDASGESFGGFTLA